ncbi:hypothetical protein OF83DRAFT_1117752 [Amylostereum chailletii]|nr:hypothetical protein OF83DRAFT_1117752 [Amylostereum chailletii]
MDLKERANALFRKHEFKQYAVLLRAEKQNPEDPTFASNLSAALFEAGDYAGCFSALSRSFTAISANPEGKEALALRLSTRLAKTLSNGLTAGSVTIARIEDEREVVEGLKAKMENEGGGKAGDEARKEWKEWGRVKVEIGGIGEKERTQARNEVAKLGVTKKPIDPVLEYYFMGHDPILSIVDDWGPGDSAPMHLDKYPFELLPNLAFLFGGVGDARHVYASLIGLHHAHARLSSARRNALHAHFTLLDIHPTMLLRDLVVLMLLERLVRGTDCKEEREEIKAAVFYTFVGVVVPEMYNKWCDLHTMVSTTPPTLPAWLHLSPDAAAGVLSVLKKWDPFPPARTAQNIIMHYSYRPTPVELLTKTLSQPNLAAQTSARRQKILATLTNYPASLKEVMARVPNGPYPSLTRAQAVEELWHQATTTFVPPKRALAHLPKSAILLEFMQSAERRVHGKETLEGIHQEVGLPPLFMGRK